jgi:hypothetical protein
MPCADILCLLTHVSGVDICAISTLLLMWSLVDNFVAAVVGTGV